MRGWVLLLLLGVMAPSPPVRAEITGLTRAEGKPVANAVVWLDASALTGPVHPHKAVLDQRNLTFYPHVLAVQVGATVEFPNNDRVLHNVFTNHDGKVFDLGLYPVGAVKFVRFDHPGLSRIYCNIHPNMSAYILAVDTPCFGVSDRSGRFVLPSVAPGTYTYHAWRPGGIYLQGQVVVRPGVQMEVEWTRR